MAPCSNNEILKASVTYNHTTKKKRKERKGEIRKEKGEGWERGEKEKARSLYLTN